ncbi:MAG TPA: redoxin domain-containing protein [Chitinophagaceae bacterium]|jgi:peroxiredoxin
MQHTFKILTLFLLITFNVSAQTPALTIPDFNFFKLDNSVFTNKNLAPDKMLFFFFFDAECEHCQHAMTNLNQHYEEYKKAAVYLISLDSKEKIDQFMNKYGPNLNGKKNVTLLQDLKNEFIIKFKPRKYPSMFLYSVEKKLIDYEDNEESMFRFSKRINAPAK